MYRIPDLLIWYMYRKVELLKFNNCNGIPYILSLSTPPKFIWNVLVFIFQQDKQELPVSSISHEIVAEQKGNSPMDTSSEQGHAFSKLMLPAHVADIDKGDSDNPQLVSEYVNDIYDYLRDLEVSRSIIF